MKAKFVFESMDGDTKPVYVFPGTLPMKINPVKFSNEHPEYKDLIRGLVLVNNDQMMGKKLDLLLFYRFLKKSGYKFSEEKMKGDLFRIAPALGISKFLKISKEEASGLKMKEGMINDNIDPADFKKAEVPLSDLEDEDIIIRSADGDTEPIAYRFNYRLPVKVQNYLKGTYAADYGNPEKIWWENYLDSRPILAKHIKDDEHLHKTRGDEFKEDVYN